jgi:hypothetical protein
VASVVGWAAAAVVLTAGAAVAEPNVPPPDTNNTRTDNTSHYGVNLHLPGPTPHGSGVTRPVVLDPNEEICVTYTPPANQDPVYSVAKPPAGQTAADGHNSNIVCAPRYKIQAAMAAGGDIGQNCLNTNDGKGCGVQYGVWTPNAAAAARQVALDLLAELNLTKPQINTSPDAAHHLVVGLPTWLWLDGKTKDQTASRGPITIHAHMTADWSTDEGQVSCTGAGTPYVAGTSDPRAASPDCGYTFRRANPNHTITAQVTWVVTYTVGAGAPQQLPVSYWTVVKNVAVDEVQAVNG